MQLNLTSILFATLVECDGKFNQILSFKQNKTNSFIFLIKYSNEVKCSITNFAAKIYQWIHLLLYLLSGNFYFDF